MAAALVIAAIGGGLLLVVPAARRRGLGAWHPAVAWIILELVFFGAGSAILAVVDGRAGPAVYVGGAVGLFAVGVAVSDRFAARRGAVAEPPARADEPINGIRPVAVVGLVVLGVVALLPTLVSVGIPFLAGDITGARAEIGGLDLQLLRVALPAAVLVAVIRAIREDTRRAQLLALAVFVVAVAAELALASRYLSAELVAIVVLGVVYAGNRIPVRVFAAVGLVGAGLFAGVGILRAYDQAAGRELDFVAQRTVNRILLIQPRTLDALQVVIPAEQPFFDGLTWLRRAGPLLGRGDIPNLGYWIYPRLFPDQSAPGYAAPGLIGEAWANFGPLGLAPFAVLGVLVERLGAFIARRRRDPADVVLAALATLFVARTHAIGLDGLIVLVVVVGIWRVLAAPVGGLVADVAAVARWRP